MKNKAFILLIVLLFIMVGSMYSQRHYGRGEIKKNAISANLFGPSGWVGITYERIIIDYLSAEIGIGYPGAGLGVKAYPLGIKPGKVNFIVGVSGTYINPGEGTYRDIWVYFPVGFIFMARSGLNLGVDLGPAYGWDIDGDFSNGPSIWGNLRLGYRF